MGSRQIAQRVPVQMVPTAASTSDDKKQTDGSRTCEAVTVQDQPDCKQRETGQAPKTQPTQPTGGKAVEDDPPGERNQDGH